MEGFEASVSLRYLRSIQVPYKNPYLLIKEENKVSCSVNPQFLCTYAYIPVSVRCDPHKLSSTKCSQLLDIKGGKALPFCVL